MNSSISIIGGADDPASIFLEEIIGISWLNIFGLILIVLLLVPNIIYALKEKNQEENILEADNTGSYSDWHISAKWYSNAKLIVDYICGYFWNRTFICH